MSPRPEHPDVTFLYPQGLRVQFAGNGRTYVIRRQRYETREVMGPLVEYLLRGRKKWVAEADLFPVEEATRAEGLPP